MKILTIAPFAPSLVKARTFQLVRELAVRGHEITVLATSPGDGDDRDGDDLDLGGIPTHVWRLGPLRLALNAARGLLSPNRPFQADYCWDARVVRRASRLVRERAFDVVHVAHLRAARLGLAVQSEPGGTGGVPMVWDAADCMTDLLGQTVRSSGLPRWRWLARIERGRTRRFERDLIARFTHVTVAGRSDREALLGLLPEDRRESAARRISIVPNGVDLDRFPPRPELTGEGRAPTGSEPFLVMTGTMTYHPNVTAAIRLVREIMPRVWETYPGLRLLLVGASPSRAVRRLPGQAAGPVEVTGWVPDIGDFLRRSALAVAPLTYGSGTQFKVLEAMATGTVCVTTESVASSVGAEPGRHLVVANGDDDFARRIVWLLHHPDDRRRIGAHARGMVERHFDWRRIAAGLESTYLRVRREVLAEEGPEVSKPASPAREREASTSTVSRERAAH